ncbi:MAG TPA: hypothetical protein VEK38_04485 [Candidatus Bathyarchaeia archaeon]|nr:hypothetical protein [Candidatus Bathyarchaeia archaeon]
MKQKFHFAAFFSLLSSFQATPSIGCLDDSWHLEKAHDSKELHSVSCACPCKTLTFYHGLWCLDCGHAHMTHPQKIASSSSKSSFLSQKPLPLLPGHKKTPQNTLKTLIQSHFKTKIEYK